MRGGTFSIADSGGRRELHDKIVPRILAERETTERKQKPLSRFNLTFSSFERSAMHNAVRANARHSEVFALERNVASINVSIKVAPHLALNARETKREGIAMFLQTYKSLDLYTYCS